MRSSRDAREVSGLGVRWNGGSRAARLRVLVGRTVDSRSGSGFCGGDTSAIARDGRHWSIARELTAMEGDEAETCVT